MEDLTGGSLTLEQRYEIEKFEGVFANAHVYRGTQYPIQRPVWIHILPHPSSDKEIQRTWVEKVRSGVLRSIQFSSHSFYEILDFGEVNNAPFIVYQRDNMHRISDILRIEGTLEQSAVELIAENLTQACLSLEESGFSHGAIHPSFVFIGDEGNVKLIQAGVNLSPQEIADAQIVDKNTRYGISPSGDYSDTYAIACLAYELLSGVHPFLDEDGDIISIPPTHPVEYGVDLGFSNKIIQQFDTSTQDLYAFLGTENEEATIEYSKPLGKKVKESKEDLESIDISNKIKRDYKLPTAIVVILLLIGVLLYQFTNSSGDNFVKIKGTKITLTTEPEGAEVILNKERIGFTPFDIDSAMMKIMPLEIQKEGYKKTTVIFSQGQKLPVLRIPLQK